jgi:hypothetical protein
MNWLNLSIQTLDSEHFLGSDPVERATWLCLLRYCIGQENGGTIPTCAGWADRKWQQLVRVTRDEVQSACDLWQWHGDTLIVWGYPIEKEQEVQRNRESGARGGLKGGKSTSEAKAEAAKTNGSKGGRPKTQSETQSETESGTESETQTERNRKEKEKEALPPTPQSEASESDRDFYSDHMPSDNAKAMLELEKRVQAIKSGWGLPLGYQEQRLLAAASRTLSALNLAQWQTLKDYMHARIPEGRPAWQPRTRTKFLETVSDVWNYASEWHRKNQSNQPANTIPMPSPSQPRAILSREELAEVFGDPQLRKKM